MKSVGLEMSKARANLMNEVYKFDEKQRQEMKKKTDAIEKSKPTGTKLVRKGNKLYKVDMKTGSETLVGIYVKTPSGKEVLKPVAAVDPLLDLGEAQAYDNEEKLQIEDNKSFDELLDLYYDKNGRVNSKNR
jgi:hypothetical protein